MPERAKRLEDTMAAAPKAQKPEPAWQAEVSAPDAVLGHARGVGVPPGLGEPSEVLAMNPVLGNRTVMRILAARWHGSGSGTGLVKEESIQRLIEALREPSDQEIHSAAAAGVRTPATTLPSLDRIQTSFGHHSVSHIKAHVGTEAGQATRAMNALAFASGDHVVFGGTPDLRTAAHEAAHVVQQRAGVQLEGGIGRAGDTYERNAEEVADTVVAGRSAEGLLNSFATVPAVWVPSTSVGEISLLTGFWRVGERGEPIAQDNEPTRQAGDSKQKGAIQRFKISCMNETSEELDARDETSVRKVITRFSETYHIRLADLGVVGPGTIPSSNELVVNNDAEVTLVRAILRKMRTDPALDLLAKLRAPADLPGEYNSFCDSLFADTQLMNSTKAEKLASSIYTRYIGSSAQRGGALPEKWGDFYAYWKNLAASGLNAIIQGSSYRLQTVVNLMEDYSDADNRENREEVWELLLELGKHFVYFFGICLPVVARLQESFLWAHVRAGQPAPRQERATDA